MIADLLFGWLVKGKPWVLSVEDTTASCASIVIVGQGVAQGGINYRRSLESNQTASPGDFRPAVAITGAQADTISFTASWMASSILDDMEAIARDILTLADKDPVLGRTPILRLTAGDISELVRLTSVDVTFSEGKWALTEKHTGLDVALSLVAHNEKSFSSLPYEPETTEVILGETETFENLAWRYYKDPLLGLGLRRCNPTVLLEAPGERILVYETNHSMMLDADKIAAPLLCQETFGGDVSERAVESLAWGSTPWASIAADEKEFDGWL
jgi:hypothetical protein